MMKRFGVKPSEAEVAPPTTLGPWFANVFAYRRVEYVICMNEATLYTIPIRLAKRDTIQVVQTCLGFAMRGAMQRLGIERDIADRVVNECRDGLVVTPTFNQRKPLGSLNDLMLMAEYLMDRQYEEDRTINLMEIEYQFNVMPQRPIGWRFAAEALADLCGKPGIKAELLEQDRARAAARRE